MSVPQVWTATREWNGEIGFIVAGGPSVALQDLELLKGRRIIAVNNSFEKFTDAGFLVFSDSRWWHHYKQRTLTFKGRIVSACSTVFDKNVHRMRRKSTVGLSSDPAMVTIKMTTLTVAINLAVHLGCKGICLLGADGKAAADGKLHHHADHPWKHLRGAWDKQKKDLAAIVPDLKKLGIECVNASPGSAWADLWPVMPLKEAIEHLEKMCSPSSLTDTSESVTIFSSGPSSGKFSGAESIAQSG